MAITYEKSADRAAEVVRAIEAQGRRAVAIQADSADVTAVQASVEKTVAELGGLDILVNNAGILRVAELKDISVEDIDAILNVNVRGPIVASKAALPHLTQGGSHYHHRKLLRRPCPVACSQCVRGVEVCAGRVHEGLARELGPKEITVNLVQPGSINTDMNPANGPFGETLRQITAFGRYGAVDDIANAVAFLASAKAQYITGSTLTVDGGAIA